MRARLLRWLRCPQCKRELGLRIKEAVSRTILSDELDTLAAVAPVTLADRLDSEILVGALTCESCRLYYPVVNSIPRMLTYPTQALERFVSRHRAWIESDLAAFSGVSGPAPRGERLVLRSFSREWLDYDWDGKAYWSQSPEDVLTAKRFELGVLQDPLPHRLALELGIGIGAGADALSRSERWEIVGVDLSYAVDQAVKYFGGNPLLHIVQASVFALPFAPEQFDVVYSHGVIHHTHSTSGAFGHLACLPKRPGGMLYVWVYSTDQEKATPLRRLLMALERVVRPVLARLPSVFQTILLAPAVPVYMLYQNAYRRGIRRETRLARYGAREALHAARDRLTPLFAWRHTYSEVRGWFHDAGFRRVDDLRRDPRPAGVEPTYVINVGVRGFRE